MSQMKVVDQYGNLDGRCFGLWDISMPECSRCLVVRECETKTRRNGSVCNVEPACESSTENIVLPDITPLDYMMDSLRGALDCKEAENPKAKAHYFSKDDKVVFTVIISKSSGKIKMQAGDGRSKVVSEVESIEHAEELIRELVDVG